MEHGFYHPDRGYWQTTNAPPPDILAGYPAGTVEVPLKPGADYDWDGSAWVYVAPPPDPEQVKQARIAELKQLLRDTDYVALPDYDKDKPDVLAQRQAWRDELRELSE
jgi:hypothetical protein